MSLLEVTYEYNLHKCLEYFKEHRIAVTDLGNVAIFKY